ncbi:MAG: UbiA family prenyltransferase [Candidatus Kariarchaeaceae archaeon]|jgi:geranylgeranylglycerol-phosphate geranylgeranyltransferase
MLKDSIYGFLKLIRFGVSLFGCIGLFVSGLIAGDLRGIQFEYLIAFFIVFISGAGAFAINDYYDFEVDKINERKDRPLVIGLISRNVALITAVFSIIIVIILSLLLNLTSMILVFISVPLFYIYSMGLKKRLIIKNILIAYSYLSTIFLGSLITDSQLEPIIIYFGIMGFIVGLANEIMFDIADVEGDNERMIKTIATKYGKKTAALISVFLYLIIMVLDPLPFILRIDQRLYGDYLFLVFILFIVASYIVLSLSLLKNQSKENVLRLRTIIFLIMQGGTITYLIGVLI